MPKPHYTYNPALCASGGRDEVRYRLGDTDVGRGDKGCFLCDEEIDACLGGATTVTRKILLGFLENIRRKIAWLPDEIKIDVMQYKWTARVDAVNALYEELTQAENASIGFRGAEFTPPPAFRRGAA